MWTRPLPDVLCFCSVPKFPGPRLLFLASRNNDVFHPRTAPLPFLLLLLLLLPLSPLLLALLLLLVLSPLLLVLLLLLLLLPLLLVLLLLL